LLPSGNQATHHLPPTLPVTLVESMEEEDEPEIVEALERISTTDKDENNTSPVVDSQLKAATTIPSSQPELVGFLTELQQKYFHNLEIVEQLSKENNNLSTELKNSHHQLKHERKCNRLHRLLKLSKSKEDPTDEEDRAESPPNYPKADISFSTKKARPKSADSIFNKTKRRAASLDATATSEDQKKLELEEVEYRQEQAEYNSQKFQQQQREQQFLQSLRRSYELKPPLDWKTFQEMRNQRRERSQQRREEHYQKWKVMNRQVQDYNQMNQSDDPHLVEKRPASALNIETVKS
jgi:hypothetical protein